MFRLLWEAIIRQRKKYTQEHYLHLAIGMALFHTPQISSVQKIGDVSADTGRSSRVSAI